jgi:hypothetical protein
MRSVRYAASSEVKNKMLPSRLRFKSSAAKSSLHGCSVAFKKADPINKKKTPQFSGVFLIRQ